MHHDHQQQPQRINGDMPLATHHFFSAVIPSESDNTAGNMLLKRICFAPVNALLEQLDAHQTRVQRLFLDEAARQAGRDNVTSPADMLRILQVLEQGDVTGNAGAQELLTAMKQSDPKTSLPALLPPSVEMAHKTGVLIGIEHDVGIVYLPEQRYIIVMMSRDLSNNDAGKAAIARASWLVYDWFTQ